MCHEIIKSNSTRKNHEINLIKCIFIKSSLLDRLVFVAS